MVREKAINVVVQFRNLRLEKQKHKKLKNGVMSV